MPDPTSTIFCCPHCHIPPTRHYKSEITWLACDKCSLRGAAARIRGNGITKASPTPDLDATQSWNMLVREIKEGQ